MQINNFEEVRKCLKEWETMRTNVPEAIHYLSLGNQYAFERTKVGDKALHAYPGICAADQSFYMFLIDETDDRPSSFSELFEAITICKVKKSLNDNPDEVPEAVAQKRMTTWREEFAAWTTKQINLTPQTQGLFKAFHVPSDYLKANRPYKTVFGLKEEGSSPTGYLADLITIDLEQKELTYYDTVRPVPPFSPILETNFYLLSLVTP